MRLQQLKDMTEGELQSYWMGSNFPFDGARDCNRCLTSHAVSGTSPLAFKACSHEQLVKETMALNAQKVPLHPILDQLYALRLFYADLYPNPVPVEAWEDYKPGLVLNEELAEVCT